MDNKIEVIIRKSLEYYDKQIERNLEEIDIIDRMKISPFHQFPVDESDENKIKINSFRIKKSKGEVIFDFEQLALFDVETKTWCWSWCIPIILSVLTVESKFLLKYGLSL